MERRLRLRRRRGEASPEHGKPASLGIDFAGPDPPGGDGEAILGWELGDDVDSERRKAASPPFRVDGGTRLARLLREDERVHSREDRSAPGILERQD